MAIVKSIPIHSIDGIINCISYTTDKGKTTVFEGKDGSKVKVQFDSEGNILSEEGSILSGVSNALKYAENVEKTAFRLDDDEDVLVSGFNCDAESAPYEFLDLKYSYEQALIDKGVDPKTLIKGKKRGEGKYKGQMVDKEAREAYHIIMSFDSRPDLSAGLIHMIGLEFCEKAFPDTKVVVSTHMNTDHLHNHIVRSAYNMSSPTKYRDTMENLEKMRDISDELSLKYGIDIIIARDRENKPGHSYIEEKERKRGCSWKEILKEDIKKSIKHAHSWEEYRQIMTSAGYGVRERPSGVTYYFLNDENKRIRENRLGSAFTRDAIKHEYHELTTDNKYKSHVNDKYQDISHDVRIERDNRFKKDFSLYIPRYTVTGRRRSDTELIFLAAIKLIKRFGHEKDEKDKVFEGNPVYHSMQDKVKTMEQSLLLSSVLGLKDGEHLKSLKNMCGAKKSAMSAELNSIENVLRSMSILNAKADDLMRVRKEIKDRGLEEVDLMQAEYTEKQKRDNFANLMPMSPKMRRDLFMTLENSGYRVAVKYDSISFKEGKAIIDYVNGKGGDKPDILLTDDEFYERRYLAKEDEPDLKDVNDKKNKSFDIAVKDFSDEDKRLLYLYRMLVNEIISYGYSIDDLVLIEQETDKLSKRYLELKKEVQELSLGYRNLSRLEHNLNLAKNGAYTLSNDKGVQIVVEENKEPDTGQKTSVNEELSLSKEAMGDEIYKEQEIFTVEDAYFDLTQ